MISFTYHPLGVTTPPPGPTQQAHIITCRLLWASHLVKSLNIIQKDLICFLQPVINVIRKRKSAYDDVWKANALTLIEFKVIYKQIQYIQGESKVWLHPVKLLIDTDRKMKLGHLSRE